MHAALPLLVALTQTVGAAAPTALYEAPEWHPADVLELGEREAALYRVRDPITTDGLMPEYVLETKFGPLPAYSHRELLEREQEVRALEVALATRDLSVILDTTKRQVEGSLKTVAAAAKDPVGLIVGLPRGVVNLFRGAAAQVREFGREAAKETAPADPDHAPASTQDTAEHAEQAAAHYADRYLGLSADERGWFERLGVNPYTDNVRLREAVKHLAHVEAATALGLRLAALPSIPYAGDVQRAMDAVYHEDPAVLREERRSTLLGYGLAAEDIDRFENTAVMSPTRQHRLVLAAAGLNGVSGRDVLFRQAALLKSEDEADIYVDSSEFLRHEHEAHPLVSLLPDVRLPAGVYADGSGGVVTAAVEAVYWTATVDAAERTLAAGLPTTLTSRTLRIRGTVSERAKEQLTARGWTVVPTPRAP
jgi:hypothetical protein